MKNKLTVVLVLRSGGDFHFSDVELLAHHIHKNWEGTLQTVCITDLVEEPASFKKNLLLIPMKGLWKGWWSKMNMFSEEMEKYRPFLYMDLDTTVVGSLNDLFPLSDPDHFVTLTNVYFPGKIGSGLMWIPAKSEKVNAIWNKWIANPEKGALTPGGDQCFIEQTVKPDSYFETNRITSFKPLPFKRWITVPDSKHRIIYFHGFPRIPVAAKKVSWIAEYMQKKEKMCKSVKKAYVINREDRPDRLKEFNKQEFPFNVERFPAVIATPGIKGCNLSHKKILEKRELPVLVFEDDCKMIEDWSVVQKAMKSLPAEWDILYIGANLNEPLERVSGELLKAKKVWTTHAVIYRSERVANYIISKMPSDGTPIDVFYSKMVLPKFNCYVVDPICAVQKAGYSDIVSGERDYEKLMIDNFYKHTSSPDFKRWFADKGDTTLRLTYSLSPSSVVFDVGGYKGDFCDAILKKYECFVYIFEAIPTYYDALVQKYKGNDRVNVIHKAFANSIGKQEMYIHGDSSGIYQKSGQRVTVQTTTLENEMNVLGIKRIDLIKLNIEGSEYPVLEQCLQSGVLSQVDNIQVQFHTFVPDYLELYKKIRFKLAKTHGLTYRYAFVWENWKLKG